MEQRPRSRKLLGTAWPGWLLVVLIALGLPRTILADLGVIEPEGSWVYYVLALTPFAVWGVLAIVRRTTSPIKDHLVAGALYGLSLLVVHGVLWTFGADPGHPPVLTAVGIAMGIGLGVGAVAAVVAAAANRVRRVRR